MLDLCLNANVRSGFDLVIAALLILIELAHKRALNVTRPCVMPFDQVAVIGVHDPNEACEVCRRLGMQCFAKGRRSRNQFGDGIGHRDRRLV
jgi:hypothetical protein